jgi:hypothetical protein
MYDGHINSVIKPEAAKHVAPHVAWSPPGGRCSPG